MRFSLVLVVSVSFMLVTVIAGCPQPPHHNALTDGGVLELGDAGPQAPPTDGGVDDAGFAIPPDAGPVNTVVRVDEVSPPNGPLSGLNADGTQHRVLIHGDQFTPSARVFFDDVEADTLLAVQLPGIISVHPNCTSPGQKTVTVYDELGVGQLEGGYTCFSPIEVDTIVANVGSCDGGDSVTITGKGFHAQNLNVNPPDNGMIVTLGGRQVVGLTVVDDTHATFITPPMAPAGRKDLAASDEFGRSVLPLSFTCSAGLRVDAIAPNVVDDTNAVVELDGSGFEGDVAATIGGAVAARDNLINDNRLRVIVPSGLTLGAQDVVASRTDGAGNTESATCAGCLVVRPAVTGALTVTAAIPNQADTGGGTQVTLVGEQLTGTTSITVGGTAVTSFSVVDDRTIQLAAPAGPVGAAPVVVTTAAGSATLNNFAWFAPVVVSDVAPSAGPQAGGTAVAITGRGFVDPAAVTFGGVPATDCVVDSPTEITCNTAPGAAGPVDVVVSSNGETGKLANGYRYDAELTVIGVHPARGGLSGLTQVTVFGSGFTKAAPQVWFNKVDGPDAQNLTQGIQVAVVDDSTLTCLTPPTQNAGVVDVTVVAGTETATATDSFTYFNPTSLVGGASGGPIDGAVYVSVLDATTGQPVPGMYAWIGTGDHPVAAGITNFPYGQATISGPLVSGPQTVNVAGNCFSSVTWVDINATELTGFVFPTCQGPPSGSGTPPPPPPPALVRGHVFGFAKEFFDPAAIDQSGCGKQAPLKCQVALAEVTTTTPDEFSGNPPLQTDSVRDVFEEGGAYFLDGTRTGRLAIIAIAGIFDTNNEIFEFKQLGIRRAVFPQHGVELDNQDVELTIPLDSSIQISLPDAPLRPDSDAADVGFVPTITRVVPAIQLGGEGAFVYTQEVAGTQNLTLTQMPEVPGSLLTFVAGAYTTDGRSLTTNTGAIVLTQGNTLVSNPGTSLWSVDGNNDGSPDIVGQVLVTNDPATGVRFASVIQGCEHPQAQTGQNGAQPDFTQCGDSDGDGETWVQMSDPWPFASSTGAQPYHIGNPDAQGGALSQVVQDGIGDVTRGGVTVQPVLGLPTLVSPLESGVLAERTLRWKPAPGQQPTIHDMFLFDPFALSSVVEVYADGSRTKIIVPKVPLLDAIEASLPQAAAACVADPTVSPACAFFGLDPSGQTPYVPPGDMVNGGIAWQHQQIFAPNMDSYDNWSLIDIGSRGQRSLTQTTHFFVHGDDH